MEEKRTFIGRLMDAVARTSYDREFRERFLADPRKAFEEEDVQIPEDIAIELIMDEPEKMKVIVPVFNEGPIFLPDDPPTS